MCCNPREGRLIAECCESMMECCSQGPLVRRFRTSKEEEERLQAYKEELEKEIAGVSERIQELRKK